MAELYLVRHGQASFGAENYDELSPSGRTQSSWLGEYFAQADLRFDRVVIGTMQRHRQTADAILAAMGGPQVELAQDAGLNEYDFEALFAALGDEGLPSGLSVTSSKKDFYKGLRQVLQLWADDRLPGVVPETWQQFQTRVQRARSDIQRAGGRRVLVVSSGGPIAVTAQQVLQTPAATAIALNLQIRNSSVCQYVFNDNAMSLVSFNSVPHLEHAERREFVTYG
ncbi:MULTISPECIES: histidine phosphatase family protein [Paraburkholderia]|uniref:Histidine phosphatase family protein n=1 Tax=Paraburkholderia madseniana TaxID=2599607 RepID=A0A6N6WIQ6_9BURK|nr:MULTISPECIES: histidine phosphatase family protein [Paraburkholderia]KAE8759899.1 histidine phosphatase family protein [Paraburkholderia madseniana]MCX4169802.1 histidine phosphatase family protein [Paraburkholderia madseniana]MDQ6457814.1 histidine phosphatase family protein [Paraburkholderia madseniana]NPT64826.1 histidine phosphatase family protein [Paraburkholderia madseniana]